jgi:DNA-binding Lrp family transcriptional regulator
VARRTISDLQIEQLLREGNGVSDIAKKIGASKGAVSKRLKALRVAVSKDITLRSAPEIVEKNINAVEQLQKINDYANELLDLLMRWNRGDQEALQVLESQVATKRVRVGDEVEFVKEFKFKDPRELALAAMKEIRGQLNLQLEIFRTLYDMKAVAEFQKEVLATIGEVAPDVRDQIVHNLQKRRAIRSTLDLSPAI